MLQTIQSTEITLPTAGAEHSSCVTDHNTARLFKEEIEWDYNIQGNYRGDLRKADFNLSTWNLARILKPNTSFHFSLKNYNSFDPMSGALKL
jgi:hypothetical protein